MTSNNTKPLQHTVVASDTPDSAHNFAAEDTAEWWRGAVVYQIYPRSFQDSNGNGVGDLNGILLRLPYVASLGVDAIWISPFFQSPMKDFGYDVSDYTAVDPLFGNIDHFKAILDAAHGYGIKVIIDQVLSHTSDQHAWFQASREDRENPKADWYVWADPQPDGSEPNNWWAIFGGRAWQWEPKREQYYLHNFLASQPDLNYHCDEMRAQILKEMEFWLALGVDGFRLDAINFCYHDKQLRDNPEKPLADRKGRGFSADNPYAAQFHLYDNTQPENLGFMQEIRALLNRYPGTVALGEVNSDDSLQTMAEYTRGNDKLHMAYSFELLADEFSAAYIRETVANVTDQLASGWPCWAVSNHDVARVVSRWGKNAERPQFAKMALALAASLRGTLCVYQGEELGLCEAPIEKEQLQDPFGKEFWPEFKGRDGCRTPMPWESQLTNAGFSEASPWLPIPKLHRQLAVSEQERDSNSVLNFYRGFLRWRKQYSALIYGDIDFEKHDQNVLVFKRRFNDQTLIACFNLSPHSELWQASEPVDVEPLSACEAPVLTNDGWLLAPFGFGFFSRQ